MTDLKRILMELGNRLVTEHRHEPAYTRIHASVAKDVYESKSLDVLQAFTEWLNHHKDAQRILTELGVTWRMPD